MSNFDFDELSKNDADEKPSREVISESDNVLSIDLEDPDVLKDFNSIFIGAMKQRCARHNDIISTSEYRKFWKEVRVSLNVQSTCKHQNNAKT